MIIKYKYFRQKNEEITLFGIEFFCGLVHRNTAVLEPNI